LALVPDGRLPGQIVRLAVGRKLASTSTLLQLLRPKEIIGWYSEYMARHPLLGNDRETRTQAPATLPAQRSAN
jgi:hypothetical protein